MRLALPTSSSAPHLEGWQSLPAIAWATMAKLNIPSAIDRFTCFMLRLLDSIGQSTHP